MKALIDHIKKNKAFILFLFLFSCILMLKNKIGYAESWEDFVFHLDAPFWVFINAIFVYILINVVKGLVDRNKYQRSFSVARYLKFFGLGFISYMVLKNIFIFLATIVFDIEALDLSSSYQITYEISSQILDFIIFGGFTLGYLYYNENNAYRRKLNEYELSLSKSKIKQLQAQLDPHFLFNNLNILDQLIEEDKEKASTFLHHFSELYRYALRNSEKELISIQQEVKFTQNYFQLMEEKYGTYYQLSISDELNHAQLLLPPFSLQVLVENAIKHNVGTTKLPVIITITLDQGIKIQNNKITPVNLIKSNGVALNNLSEQFKFLTNKKINITETDKSFVVVLPLINQKKSD